MNDPHFISTRLKSSSSSQSLNLSSCQLKELPAAFSSLVQLKYLYLDNNELIFVPEIGNLVTLEEISLENNQLTLIPDSFGNLRSLKCLNLSKNHLKCLNSSIFANMSNLVMLWLNNCELMYLPREIGLLGTLEKLGLKCNSLQDLPLEIGQLSKLSWINVEQNELEILPIEFKQLKNLSYLNLNKNKFASFPVEIFELANLDALFISNNCIKTINDDEIMNLSHMRKVELKVKMLYNNIIV